MFFFFFLKKKPTSSLLLLDISLQKSASSLSPPDSSVSFFFFLHYFISDILSNYSLLLLTWSPLLLPPSWNPPFLVSFYVSCFHCISGLYMLKLFWILAWPGSFADYWFAYQHLLQLTNRSFPLSCTSFDGSPGLGGPITQVLQGHISMMALEHQLFNSNTTLDITTLGNCNLILGMPWFKCHSGWVGAAGTSCLLFNPVSSTSASTSVPHVTISTLTLFVDNCFFFYGIWYLSFF